MQASRKRMTDHITEAENWADKILALYGEGAGDAEVAAMLRLPLREYYKQFQENQSLGMLVEFGRTLSQAFWESQARLNITNKNFVSSLWVFYMKNKHGWADKIDSTSTNENLNQNVDELRQQVRSAMERILKSATPEDTDAQRVLKQMRTLEGDGEV